MIISGISKQVGLVWIIKTHTDVLSEGKWEGRNKVMFLYPKKMMNEELQTLLHQQDHSRDGTIQPGVQNSGNCPSIPCTISAFCSFIFISIPYSLFSPGVLSTLLFQILSQE